MAKVVDLDFLKSISLTDPIKEDDFTEYDYTEVIYCKGTTSYLIVVGTHKQHRHRAVSSYYHQALCDALGRQCPFRGDATIPEGKAASAVSLLRPQSVRELSQVLAALPKISLFDQEGV